jgi:CRISPR-associated protein Csx16
MPRTILVTRHPGAIEWLARRLIKGRVVAHLDPDLLSHGDTVVGNLPAHLAAAVCARGARYLHLQVELTPGDRGTELSADLLEARGATLVDLVCAPARP